jgi:1-acyl-sn-glycerol-3-phosphate acyltransferase
MNPTGPLPTGRDDLEHRDPDYVREMLPMFWMIASFWFRAEVRGLDKIPPTGPVLLVGNHSGGNVTPDTIVFAVAFSTFFGAERPFYQLAHSLVMAMPGLRWLRKCGSVSASPENADRALVRGGRRDPHRGPGSGQPRRHESVKLRFAIEPRLATSLYVQQGNPARSPITPRTSTR